MIAIIVAVVIILYLYALSGRTGHRLIRKLRKWRYAHRGLHNDQYPENSMGAFRNAIDHGFGIEFDVHLLADGNLGVLHDSKLERITGRPGLIEDLSVSDLGDYHLQGSEYTIPTFEDVLTLFDGKRPLIIELKTCGDNFAALTDRVCAALNDYHGLFCLESFDPRVVRYLYQKYPQYVRGQLSENSLRMKDTDAKWYHRLVMTLLLSNFLTKPDFIAYRVTDSGGLSLWLCRHLWHLPVVSWTIRSADELKKAEDDRRIPIFENFIPDEAH